MEQYEKVRMVSDVTHCPVCNNDSMDVCDSRKYNHNPKKPYGGYIRRRKKCTCCGYRMTTYEISVEDFQELQYLYQISKLTSLSPSSTTSEKYYLYHFSKKLDQKFEELKNIICKRKGENENAKRE